MEKKVLFFLGAGFSKQIANFPVLSELHELDKVFNEKEFPGLLELFKDQNLEEIFTLLELGTS